jgi:predicted HTH transcriptional regulator
MIDNALMSDNLLMVDNLPMGDNGPMGDNARMSDKWPKLFNEPMCEKTNRDKLLDYMSENDEVTAAEVAVIIDRSASTARRLLAKLVAEGLAVTTGANRNRKYMSKR